MLGYRHGGAGGPAAPSTSCRRTSSRARARPGRAGRAGRRSASSSASATRTATSSGSGPPPPRSSRTAASRGPSRCSPTSRRRGDSEEALRASEARKATQLAVTEVLAQATDLQTGIRRILETDVPRAGLVLRRALAGGPRSERPAVLGALGRSGAARRRLRGGDAPHRALARASACPAASGRRWRGPGSPTCEQDQNFPRKPAAAAGRAAQRFRVPGDLRPRVPRRPRVLQRRPSGSPIPSCSRSFLGRRQPGRPVPGAHAHRAGAAVAARERAGGAPRGGVGQPGQGRVPGHAFPRAAHARSTRSWAGRTSCGRASSTRRSARARSR